MYNTLIQFDSKCGSRYSRHTHIHHHYNEINHNYGNCLPSSGIPNTGGYPCNPTDCDINKLINTIADKFDSTMIKDRLILEFYERLYNEVIIHVNEILINFQNSTIEEVIELYNQESFLLLITKVSIIKNNLLEHFCDSESLPKYVNVFIDNYIQNLYTLLHSFQYMVSYISQFNIKNKCCDILSSLENIQQYVQDHYRSDGTTMGATAVTSLPLVLKEPYNTYIERHGAPGEGGFITSLLADISAELGI